MTLVLEGATQLAKSKNFETIISRETIPTGFRFQTEPDEITILGENPDTLYGNSKGTFLKTALLATYQVSTGKAGLQTLDLFPTKGPSWIDESSMTHVAPLPTNLNLLSIDDRFSRYSYRFSDPTTPQGFIYIHSGYAFGGHRHEPRYPAGKPFGPEDCSSWMAKICGTSTFSTIDQLYHYRITMKRGIVSSDWKSSPTATMMSDTYDVVQDPQKDIRPGNIYCHRAFNVDNDPTLENSAGTSGHTTLVLGFKSAGQDSQIISIGYGRNMPKEEGFGIQTFPLFPSENKKVMLFSKKTASASANANILIHSKKDHKGFSGSKK